jgi:hypothetical protein
VPSNAYIASVLSVTQAGLVPVFVEPSPTTYLLDPNLHRSGYHNPNKGHSACSPLRSLLRYDSH